ncbi:MAG: LacI family transcriptional regulator [Sulfuricurvum sp. GWF2_44_89]|uniref:LacI family transcriptional regulator n=1 Tax=Sulfuricurvum kujiense TaxID=148813 RepID=A0A2D3WH84_9BACT|nr:MULTISPECIES: substrate-binding domain-containing protein [Sulfuricurvum]OHD77242.1 MAG: LacI family transcriptional regulator [Sulfuricurvum sp. GWF2_44_89]OHD95696.1 MAG: LacI family transcriptional regulator [Sulfuricurvum sp. RIFOXYD12_FULL_44_77]OHD97993.1 MAG: LacI family transcriptional regulator [Sulfuricurvum sp. RIFOXYD2_FULL_44_160]DAB38097.1 MAG TPA: LacI family transcriptional regulator [Sulfuricurvum kujiense]
MKKFILLVFFIAAKLVYAESKTIAFAQDTMGNDFRKAQVYEVRDAALKHPDVKFIYSDAKGQTSLLIRHINGFIDSKVDVIVVGTNDEKAVVPVIAKAEKSGIPVIILDRGIQGNEYTTFINSDNLKIGEMGAKYIAQRLRGKGKVLLFEGLQKADVTKLRSKGFMDEISKHKGISVIKRTGNYLRKDAIVEMEKLIVSGEKVDAIFSESDSMLSGARSAMLRHTIDPSSIITVGCDYTSEARDAIRNGTQSGSVLFPLGGKKTVETALKIFKGESVPKHIVIPVKLITKENVEKEMPIF